MKNYSKGYTTSLVILGTLIIIALGIWGYIKYTDESQLLTQQNGWEIYTDSQQRYSFKYPKDFTLDRSANIINSGIALKFPTRYSDGTNLSEDSYIHIDVKDNVLDCSAEIFTENRGAM
ncbi:hypothetical protein H0W32_01425, partial [Patescibacteria group bacterium]|nr:hypothetical protein [Patescibacteria group bacterium]